MQDSYGMSSPSNRLYSILSLVSLGGLVAFLLADRMLFNSLMSGNEFLSSRLTLLFLPIMVSVAGAFAIFKSSFEAIERQLQERELTRLQHMIDLEHTYQSVMFALVAALDSRDHLAQGHSRRVVGYALAIADKLGLSPDERRDLAFGGYLHDVGKIGIEDALLRKKSSFSDKDWLEMRKHPVIGHEILHEVDFLGGASDVVLRHHERYDGSGYPGGLKGAEIPLLARVFAVADAFDAMTADRPYRKAMPFAEASAIIAGEVGKQFCPECTAAFLSLQESELQQVRLFAEEGRREGFWGRTAGKDAAGRKR